jgi:MscS family membrane protein
MTPPAKQNKYFDLTFWVLLITSILFIVISRLDVQGRLNLDPDILRVLRSILAGIGGFVAARLLYRITKKRLNQYLDQEVPKEQIILLDSLLRFIILLLPLLFVLNQLGLTLNNITLILGLLTTGLAFAVRDILISLLAWMMLLMRRPIRIGDRITIDDQTGRVLTIDTFFVTLDPGTADTGSLIRVPNRIFLEKPCILQSATHVAEKLVWPVESKMPSVEQVQQQLLPIIGEGSRLQVYAEVKTEAPYLRLNVRYLVSPESRNDIRTRVIMALSEM